MGLNRKILIILCALSPFLARGENSKPKRFFVSTSFSYAYADSKADDLATTYSKKMDHPMVASLGAGLRSRRLFFGVHYEYWFAERIFDSGGSLRTDTLNLQNIGLELGFFLIENPRVFLKLSAIGNYPLLAKITTATGAPYLPTTTPFNYSGLGQLGIRFSRFHSFFVEAGYRNANLKTFRQNQTPFIDIGGEQPLDLSGFFGGVGIAFEF